MKLKAVECEVERLLAVIAGKWKVLIMRELFHGARRHAQLYKALPGISQKVLTAQLRELELDGVVQRQDFGTKRPHGGVLAHAIRGEAAGPGAGDAQPGLEELRVAEAPATGGTL